MVFRSLSAMQWLLLIALCGIGVWLRVSGLTANPIWYDERASLLAACGQIGQASAKYGGRVSAAVLDDVGEDSLSEKKTFRVSEVLERNTLTNVPSSSLFWDRGNGLFFSILLHLWLSLFGYSDLAARTLPCVLGCLAIPATFIMGARATSVNWIGLLGALLVSCNALLVEFSREVRPYSLAVLLGILCTYVFIDIIIRKDSDVVASALFYAALLICLAFTHYLAIPAILTAHAIGLLAALLPRKCAAVFLVAVSLMMLSLAAWMAWGGYLGLRAMAEHDHLWLQRARDGMFWWLTVFDWKNGIRLLIERTVQYNFPLFAFWPPDHIVNFTLFSVFSAVALAGLTAVALSLEPARRAALLVLISSAAGGLLSVFLSWRSGHTLPFLDRYFTFYIPFQSIVLATAICGSARLRRFRWGMPASIMLICGFIWIISANFTGSMTFKTRENFSLDAFAENVMASKPDKTAVHCRSLDSALVLALKLGTEGAQYEVSVSPDLQAKALLKTGETINGGNKGD